MIACFIFAVNSCMCEVNTDQFELDDNLMDSIRKVDRCLRVLENVSCLPKKNNIYCIYFTYFLS